MALGTGRTRWSCSSETSECTIRFLFNDDFSLRPARDPLTLETRLRCIGFGCSGWQLGEHALWAKMSVFESATHVPLIIRAPFRPNSVGAVTPVLAEMVDLYLTLADLAGLVRSLCVPANSNGCCMMHNKWSFSAGRKFSKK